MNQRKKMDNNENTWDELLLKVSKQFNILADFDFLLFLIGIQEKGVGYQKFSKEEKMDLINLARCVLFEKMGFYKREGDDEAGWPTFSIINDIKDIAPSERESILKDAMIKYLSEKL